MYFFYIRPRRFGKSLTLSMLRHYYDVKEADKFDSWFKGLYIGEHPTPSHNTYLVLYFNFSVVNGKFVPTRSRWTRIVTRSLLLSARSMPICCQKMPWRSWRRKKVLWNNFIVCVTSVRRRDATSTCLSMNTTISPIRYSLSLHAKVIMPWRLMARVICVLFIMPSSRAPTLASSVSLLRVWVLSRWMTWLVVSISAPTIRLMPDSMRWLDSQRRKCVRCWKTIPRAIISIIRLMSWSKWWNLGTTTIVLQKKLWQDYHVQF